MQKLSPQPKLLVVMVLSSLAIFSSNLWLLFGLLTISFLLAGLSLGSYGQIVKRLVKMLPLFLTLGITLIVFSSVAAALASILRIAVIVTSALIFSNTSSRDFVQALLSWRIPYEIAFMVMIAMRFFPIFMEEAQDIFSAVQMRGVEFNKLKLKEKISLYAALFLPLVLGAVNKAYQLAIAMEARGLRAYPTRTFFHQAKVEKREDRNESF